MKKKQIKHRPETWEKISKIIILDPDGWRSDGQSFNKPIDVDEWNRRKDESTCQFPNETWPRA